MRGLLGVPKGKLKRFADFNSQCLKIAIGAVNQLTDYEIALALTKRGRPVQKITISWLKKHEQARQEAKAERSRSRLGRVARRKAKVEVIL